jgi:hypothetical protein
MFFFYVFIIYYIYLIVVCIYIIYRKMNKNTHDSCATTCMRANNGLHNNFQSQRKMKSKRKNLSRFCFSQFFGGFSSSTTTTTHRLRCEMRLESQILMYIPNGPHDVDGKSTNNMWMGERVTAERWEENFGEIWCWFFRRDGKFFRSVVLVWMWECVCEKMERMDAVRWCQHSEVGKIVCIEWFFLFTCRIMNMAQIVCTGCKFRSLSCLLSRDLQQATRILYWKFGSRFSYDL